MEYIHSTVFAAAPPDAQAVKAVPTMETLAGRVADTVTVVAVAAGQATATVCPSYGEVGRVTDLRSLHS